MRLPLNSAEREQARLHDGGKCKEAGPKTRPAREPDGERRLAGLRAAGGEREERDTQVPVYVDRARGGREERKRDGELSRFTNYSISPAN